MPHGSRHAPGLLRAGVLALALGPLVAGCRTSESAREAAGIDVQPPAGWTSAPASAFAAPGTPLAAWKGPEGASLVLFRTLPDPGGTAEAAAAELATRLENLPGLRVVARRVVDVGGRPAARVEAIAPGTGDALAPTGTGRPIGPTGKGLVPTHLLTLIFPGPGRTIRLAWHYPESAAAAVAPQVEQTIAGLRIREGP